MNTDLEGWNKAAGKWDSLIAQPDSYRTHLISAALEQLLPDCQGLNILDAGCGNGFYTDWLKRKGAHVKGIDGSSEMIKLAKEKYPECEFKTQDVMQNLPGDNQSLDVIVANMLLMHLSDVANFLKESKRLLKHNGKLIFSVLHPCFNVPTARLYKTLWQKITFTQPSVIVNDYYSTSQGRFESHMGTKLSHYHRTLEEYSQALKNSGFSISEIIEPHQLPQEFLQNNPKLEYATRIPRFIFFNCRPL